MADRGVGNKSRAAIQKVQDGQWRLSGIDACLDRRSKTVMRVENRLIRAVQISLSVKDGSEGWDTEGEGVGSRKHSNGGTVFKIRRNNSDGS